MDAVDPALTDRATAALRDTAGVTDVEYLRLRWIGHRVTRGSDEALVTQES
jgi:divalent metal cation (Fe/Co/Zn/Cd) transporter